MFTICYCYFSFSLTDGLSALLMCSSEARVRSLSAFSLDIGSMVILASRSLCHNKTNVYSLITKQTNVITLSSSSLCSWMNWRSFSAVSLMTLQAGWTMFRTRGRDFFFVGDEDILDLGTSER